MIDYTRRSPGLWIGLALALATGAVCLCALAAGLWQAAGRVGWPARPAPATPVGTSPSMQAPGQIPPAKPTASTSQRSNGGAVWPLSDVPMPAEADLGTLLGSSEGFSVISDSDFADVLAFYQAEMEAQGWTKVSYGTRITEADAELQYRNDEVLATLVLARIPFIGTLVEIRLREP